ncbi:MAG: 2-keto-4-pentenoate hydratase, partial [Sedimentibacter sp.]
MSRNYTNEELSKMLYQALKSQKPIDAISEIDNEATVVDAYNIQLLNVKRALEDGEIVSGKKI